MTRAQITRDQLLLAVNVFAECPQCDEEELISALVAAGFEQLESRILSAFLPLAFGRAALETMGPIDFGETVMAKTHNGVWIQIPLSDVPVYEAALALARESYEAGIISRQSFQPWQREAPK